MTKFSDLNDGRQAIVCKYHGPGNVRGARVKATACAGSVTLEWDDALGRDDNHRAAATALANKFRWLDRPGTRLAMGGLPDGSYVFVLIRPE